MAELYNSLAPRLGCLLMLCAAARAQTGALTGTIIDQLLTPIATAKVSLLRNGLKFETTSDERGRFHFHNLSAGSYEMEVAMPGFKIQHLSSLVLQEAQRLEMPPVPLFVGMSCGGNSPREIKPLTDIQSVIIGRMVTERGNRTRPLKNAVIVLSGSGRKLTAKTDNDGRYRIEAPPGAYQVQAGPYPGDYLTFFQGWETVYWDTVVHSDHVGICE